MMPNNHEALSALLADLRRQLTAVDQNPMLPGSVKKAVNTTFKILEILTAEVQHGPR